MKVSQLKAKVSTGIVLGMCFATLASAAQRQSQQREQRQQRQREHQRQEQQQDQDQEQQQEEQSRTRGATEMAKHTQENVMRALKREALAAIKYRVFAKVAEENGNAELSELFLNTAKTESDEHLKTLFGLAKIVGSDIENIKDAIDNETYESSLMYKTYAAKARKAGDLEVAQKFEEMAQDEAKHREAFVKILGELRS